MVHIRLMLENNQELKEKAETEARGTGAGRGRGWGHICRYLSRGLKRAAAVDPAG
jgi:hypothetical protein